VEGAVATCQLRDFGYRCSWRSHKILCYSPNIHSKCDATFYPSCTWRSAGFL